MTGRGSPAGIGPAHTIVLGTVLLVVFVVLALVLGPAAPRAPGLQGKPLPASARAEAPPPVPPLILAQMPTDQARASNALVPFAAGPVPPARPFVFHGGATDRAAARICLAAALLYEAGDDPPGERAVAQVVLNRLRHPAFPKSVCGVVQQGSERRTGCQFTFTCDGALARPVAPPAWARAQRIADEALAGAVDKAVGTATHYHTDWVVPYWRGSLVKVAQVHTQIFYRYPGRWGLPSALHAAGGEPEMPSPAFARLVGPQLPFAIPPMALTLDEAALPPRQSLGIAGVPAAALKDGFVRLKDEAAGQYVVQLDPGANPGSYAVLGYTICSGKPDCLVLGWTDEESVPRALPVLPYAMRSVAFIYRKSSMLGGAQPLWDCRRFPHPVRTQCLGAR